MRSARHSIAAAGVFAAVLVSHGNAFAKNVCIHSNAFGGWTFVFKGRITPGATAAVAGYAVRDDGFASPISGGYAVSPTALHLGVTRYATGFYVGSHAPGGNENTAFHQMAVQLDRFASGSDYAWMNLATGSTKTGGGAADFVDCGTVPRFPR